MAGDGSTTSTPKKTSRHEADNPDKFMVSIMWSQMTIESPQGHTNAYF